MKSMLFSALAIFALATTGCALQQGAGGCSDGLCGNQSAGCDDCMVLSGDCNCGAPKGLKPSCDLLRCFSEKRGDRRGMGLRVNEKGSACNQGRNNGLFARMGGGSSAVAPAASMDCGCGDAAAAGIDVAAAAPAAPAGSGDCGCGDGGGVSATLTDGCGCDAGDTPVAMPAGDEGCGCGDAEEVVVANAGAEVATGGETGNVGGLLGKLGVRGCGCKLGKCKLGNCKLGGARAGAGAGAGAAIGGGMVRGGCGMHGCGLGGKLCGSCLSKLAGAGQHPYGGMIPHTAQGPGAGTGMAPAYAYPYYTTRGPRDFLMKNPPSIGY